MRVWLALFTALAALAAGFFLLPNSRARAAPGGPVLELAQAAPAVGPGFVDSFAVACTTSATEIKSSLGNMISYTCQTPASTETAGTVLVAVGDSAIGDPTFATRTSPVYSGDTIREWGGNAKAEYCRADTGTVTIFCRGLVAVSGAP
jgi:hypothetical protein